MKADTISIKMEMDVGLHRGGKSYPDFLAVQRKAGGAWETVALLDSYPDVPEGKVPDIVDFTPFEQKLTEPQTAVAIRILGRPGKGSRPDKGRSSSCAELQAYAE